MPRELATSRHRNAPPLIGFVCLSEFYQRQRCHARWFSANPLCRCSIICTEALTNSTLGLPHRRLPQTFRFGVILSQALAPLQSITRASPQTVAPALTDRIAARPFRGFLPSSVLPAMRSHLPPAGTTPNRLRCALRVSHPLDALLPARPAELISSRSRYWALPSEAFFLTLRRTPFRTPGPSGFDATITVVSALQGFSTPHEARSQAWGLARLPLRLPPWTFPPSRFLVRYDR